jgi:hypothetical protein
MSAVVLKIIFVPFSFYCCNHLIEYICCFHLAFLTVRSRTVLAEDLAICFFLLSFNKNVKHSNTCETYPKLHLIMSSWPGFDISLGPRGYVRFDNALVGQEKRKTPLAPTISYLAYSYTICSLDTGVFVRPPSRSASCCSLLLANDSTLRPTCPVAVTSAWLAQPQAFLVFSHRPINNRSLSPLL